MQRKTALLVMVGLIATALPYAQGIDTLQLPGIGEWLIDESGSPAHWLGEQYDGKVLFEPINVIIVDSHAPSADEAIKKLINASLRCGYELEEGHSAGYSAIMDGKKFEQIPANQKVAFSDKEFIVSNNHGRIMGPYLYKGNYIFAGAFSRESVSAKPALHHGFLSFAVARDNYCGKLDSKEIYKIIGKHNLGNIRNNEGETTADHDGYAIVLASQK